jgi:hypothetical protein
MKNCRPPVILGLLLGVTLLAPSCSTNNNHVLHARDSIQIRSKSEGFYAWYSELTKRGQAYREFAPVFVRSADGMTTLDFSKYRRTMTEQGFTEQLVERRIASYRTCLDNLSRITFEVFQRYNSLDQFEEIDCAFNNVHEFTRSMEPNDGAELVDLQHLRDREAKAILKLYNLTSGREKSYFENYVMMHLWKNKKGNWMISDISVETR